MHRIKLAAGLNLASDGECFTPTLTNESKKKWIDDHDLFIAELKYNGFRRDNDKAAKVLMAVEKVNHANAR